MRLFPNQIPKKISEYEYQWIVGNEKLLYAVTYDVRRRTWQAAAISREEGAEPVAVGRKMTRRLIDRHKLRKIARRYIDGCKEPLHQESPLLQQDT